MYFMVLLNGKIQCKIVLVDKFAFLYTPTCFVQRGVLDMLIYLAMIDDPSDQEKFLKILEQYETPMFNRAMRILNNESDAEDAVQDALFSIANNIRGVPTPDSDDARKFISTILINKAIDIYRKNKQNYTIPIDEVVTYDLDVHDKTSVVDEIMEYILKLPEKYRTPMILKYENEYSCREIANILDESYTNVRKLLERGRKRVNKMYEDAHKETEVTQ